MDALDSSVIAEIATRLFREIPGANSLPENTGEAMNAAADPITADKGSPQDRGEPRLPPAGLSGEGLDLGLIDGIFQSLGRKNVTVLPSPDEQPPLREHADALVRSQLYSGDNGSSDSLKSFVRKVETGYRVPGSLPADGVCVDPFALLLKESLPATPKFTSPGIFDVNAIRRDFPVLHQQVHGKPLVWFDNAATTQKPKTVINALARFYEKNNSNIHRGAHALAARATDAYEESRKKIARFLGAGTPEEIIFVRGTTEGINLVAQSYGRRFIAPGDEIVLSVLEHHANIVPWQILAQEKKAVLRIIPVNDEGEILLDRYESLLGPRTKLVALTHASNSLGTILPIEDMIRTAKRYGAKVLIDGAQSVAHLPVNVQSLDADFFVFSGHKIFGPTGIGVLYGKKELLEAMPPWQGGGNMIRNVTFEETTYNGLPAKFEAGTPNIADAVGLGAALDYVFLIGLENIGRYEKTLLDYATNQLKQIPQLRLIGTAREKVAVLSFILKDRTPEEVGRLLDGEGIAVRAGHHCAQPSLRRFGLEATVRPSLSFYNTKEEIDRLAEVLRKIVAERRRGY
ncbi:MAG: Cysteine desulfurase [Syntrophorhabdaceae bacterium PtaU1.Bin034]|nr:MAG: Cysteine desulfurase [Syntrophorhabdaceae bacterium PtaU1.Bin034]